MSTSAAQLRGCQHGNCSTRSTPPLTSMLVAPASSAFSTSSFTAVARSRITWPEQMRCTAALSMGLIAPAAVRLDMAAGVSLRGVSALAVP